MKQKTRIAALGLALTTVAASFAGTSAKEVTPVEPAATKSLCERIWDIPVLYKNDDNKIISDFRLVGRLHSQYAWVDSDQGTYNDYETRRAWLGFSATMADKKLKIVNRWRMKGIEFEDFDPEINNIFEAYATYAFSPEFNLRAGKVKAAMTREYATSSNKIITVERSAIISKFVADAPWGVDVKGKIDKWSYTAGIYADTYDGRYDQWFGDDAEPFGILRLSYDTSGILMEKSDVALDYGVASRVSGPAGLGNENIVSLSFGGQCGNFGLQTDALSGFGAGEEQYGLVLMPSYDLTDKLQAVFRYQLAYGTDNSLKLQRYERKVTSSGAEDYNAFYGGLNYYICDHKLKLMGGVEYATAGVDDSISDDADAYNGWTFMLAARMHF
ncbi:porin [Sulfuriroseicoccus oceanibius]|uniref:Phosphate-selective porin O and P n=1 Tax=Sulfuriroseicoccus oceanibius TaxID=2707525 RepID=A0A6B3LAE3_9BACT|nr:porin [Sulfuriroseicoccus oceanibius]QQL45250.1 hypothetical protein G3M56_001285 [Sulfuriroseicoccus oceanibius]